MDKRIIHFFLVRILICICMCLFGCVPQRHTIKKKMVINPYATANLHTKIDSNTNTYNPPLTIWIHGTNFLRNRLFKDVFNEIPSLKLASEINKRYKARIIANTLNKYNATRFPLSTFYIFCWSGNLNANLREKTAHHLYAELKQVITDYKQTYDCMPRIQIITHSHGGNVALNLAKIKDTQDTLFVIDTLVLLACPVQIRTMSFIDHPMFRRIYSLYSNLDLIQVIAPQLFKNNDSEKRRFAFPPFSNRCFPQREHVTQVKMKIDGNALWHNDFVKPKFLKLLPSIISELDSWDPILSPIGKPAKLQQIGLNGQNLALITDIPDVTHSLSVRIANKHLLT
ncbi:MAG TPA: hypothetical protein VJ201_02520 [Candidatus Babeliales bacterium]|nr:hypothetical protein [Candidatus Babeliales bacterium]